MERCSEGKSAVVVTWEVRPHGSAGPSERRSNRVGSQWSSMPGVERSSRPTGGWEAEASSTVEPRSGDHRRSGTSVGNRTLRKVIVPTGPAASTTPAVEVWTAIVGREVGSRRPANEASRRRPWRAGPNVVGVGTGNTGNGGVCVPGGEVLCRRLECVVSGGRSGSVALGVPIGEASLEMEVC